MIIISEQVKHFHEDLKCSALVTDWVGLNKLTKLSDRTLVYKGNYFDDDYDGNVYAVFGDSDSPVNYCVCLEQKGAAKC